MKPADIQEIKLKFKGIVNIHHFAELLNRIEKINNDGYPFSKKITAKSLYFLSISRDNRYTKFFIPKKNGKAREINVPDPYLKRIQSAINILFQIIFADYQTYCSNGFLKGKNIISNAMPHVNKKYVLNIDIENFFPSIGFRRVKSVLQLNPFNLCESNEKEKISFIVSNILTYKDALPQGAPTSPILSNIVAQRLDKKLLRFSRISKIKYTRYADDLTFSSNFVISEGVIKDIMDIIAEEGFRTNESKTRLTSNISRQEVTGLVVNKNINIKREYIRTVRAMLNNWEKGGCDYAQAIFDKNRISKKHKIDFRLSLGGKIDFIGQVKGVGSTVYKKLKNKYEYLLNNINYDQISHPALRDRLIKDNKKMESILLDDVHNKEDRFVMFCTSAFHQIENLLNYYYWKKFPNVEDLKIFMLENNPLFREKWKTVDNMSKFKEVKSFDISSLVYLFEKEFYFDKKVYYDKEITFLREIRNDESHRCSIFSLDRSSIFAQYETIKEKWRKFENKNKKPPQKQKNELDIESKVRLFHFMDSRNYNTVRNTLKSILEKVAESVENQQK